MVDEAQKAMEEAEALKKVRNLTLSCSRLFPGVVFIWEFTERERLMPIVDI